MKLKEMKNLVITSIKTESGDEYLDYYHNVESTEHLIEMLKDNFGEEFAYIGDLSILTFEIEIDKDKIWESIYKFEE